MAGVKSLRPLLLLSVCSLLRTSTTSEISDGAKMNNPAGYGYHFGPKTLPNIASEDAQEVPYVTIPKKGTFKGRVLNSTLQNRPFHAFHSIRYALQPQRFQYSEVFDGPWAENGSVYDASYFRSICPQKSPVSPCASGDEDCLYISVYCPSTLPEDLLPVMVFIHGGAYMTGEAQLYMPTKLLDKNVVVAVLQYRLGTLGFLYSGTTDAPGNMGLMDQINALRWVQKYISYWGGNPDLVTVFGQSAGGASTSLLQLSPLMRDGVDGYRQLGHQFIPMSGSALEYWTIEHDPKNSFETQVAEAGCTVAEQTEEDMVACMASKSMDEIVAASLRAWQNDQANGGLGFKGQVPVVQSELLEVNISIVIPRAPLDMVTSGDFLAAPTMTGSVRDEGSLILGLMYEGYLVPNGYYTNDTSFLQNDLFPMVAQAFGISDPTNAVPNSFRLGFLPPNLPLGDWDTMAGGLVDLTGMMFLKSGLWNLAHEMQRRNLSDEHPIFFYSFEFESADSLFQWMFVGDPEIPIHAGVGHADDLTYLFDLPGCFEQRCREMMRRHATLFTNFAKYGDPTPAEEEDTPGQWREFMDKWERFSIDSKHFAMISDNITMMQDFPLRWNYNKYGYNVTSSAPSQAVDARPVEEAESKASATEATEASSYKVATAVLSAVAACAIVALCATVVWHRRQMRKNRNALLSSDNNVVMEPHWQQ